MEIYRGFRATQDSHVEEDRMCYLLALLKLMKWLSPSYGLATFLLIEQCVDANECADCFAFGIEFDDCHYQGLHVDECILLLLLLSVTCL